LWRKKFKPSIFIFIFLLRHFEKKNKKNKKNENAVVKKNKKKWMVKIFFSKKINKKNIFTNSIENKKTFSHKTKNGTSCNE
jgi:hypothetical protein